VGRDAPALVSRADASASAACGERPTIMSEALLFPGQGAQVPGMGREWCETFPAARRVFEEADRVLGQALSDACWNQGEIVHRTDVAQPGILVTSWAITSVLVERGLDLARVPLVAGLSLGEYTALLAAGALDFADALRLVRLRGAAMQAASESIPSSMTTLLGATLEQAEQAAAAGRALGICSVANVNAPGQVVISGEIAALDAAEQAAKALGIKRAIRLTVAGGFHSECMRPASERLASALAEVELRAPRVPFVTNVTGEIASDPATIKSYLARQVCAPVLWEKSMRGALARGITRYVEPGPGAVLGGLMKKIAHAAGASATVRSVEIPEDLALTAT
jgi:[acyl-carrier-protein] S-malonyltransferase